MENVLHLNLRTATYPPRDFTAAPSPSSLPSMADFILNLEEHPDR